MTQVYAIGNESIIKIGISDCPDGRLSTLQTACPFKIGLLHTLSFSTRNGAIEAEKYFHKLFRHECEHGEWFKINIEDFIDAAESYIDELYQTYWAARKWE